MFMSTDAPEVGMDVTEEEMEYKWKHLRTDGDKKAKCLNLKLEKCIGCELCKIVCPIEGTISMGPVAEVATGELEKGTVPLIMIDQDKCIFCGLCAIVCPVDAIEFEFDKTSIKELEYPRLKKDSKFLEGTITISNLEKCDPQGCKACINICPEECWYIPEDIEEKRGDKIRVKEDDCTFCGACVNACPENLIEVKRSKVHYTGTDTPWTKAWITAFEKLIGKRAESDLSRIIEYKREEKPLTKKPPTKIPEIPEECKELLEEKIEAIEKHLRSRAGIKTRHLTEKGEKEKVLTYIQKRLSAKADEEKKS
jgi:4Fe-4S ferredoxin